MGVEDPVVAVPDPGEAVVASAATAFSSSILGTMRLSLDMRLYLMTNRVNRLHKWEVSSNSSKRVL